MEKEGYLSCQRYTLKTKQVDCLKPQNIQQKDTSSEETQINQGLKETKDRKNTLRGSMKGKVPLQGDLRTGHNLSLSL